MDKLPCPFYVQETYSISQLVTAGVGERSWIFRQLKKMTVEPTEGENHQGKTTAFYLFTSLPFAWRNKIEAYESKKAFDSALKTQEEERIREIRKGRIFTQVDQAIIKKHEEARIKQIADKQQRGEQQLLLLNTVKGNALKDAMARDYIVKACKAFLDCNGYKEEFKKERWTWNYKAVQAFCAAIVSGEIALPNEHEHIVIWKGKRSLTAVSLLSWRDKGREFGGWGLASHHVKKRGNTILTTLQTEFIEGLMYDHPHIRGRMAHKALRLRFAGVHVPSRDTVRRYMDYWKEKNKSLFLYITNPDAWKNKYMVAFGNSSADVTRLNMRWEADSTPADVMCTDGRCCIIGIIDVWSRRLRLLVSPTSKSTAVAALLRSCIIAWGVPEQFRTDNGADYTSFFLEGLLDKLAIEHQLCAPFTPESKPHIERSFGTFSHGLLELLPGYIGHSVADRKQIESRKSFATRFGKRGEVVQIAMSSAELQAFCDDWTDNIYGMDVHSSLKMSPAAKARTWIEPLRRISDERVLDVLLFAMPAGDGYRTISKKGIAVTFYGVNLQYISSDFAGHVGERVEVKIDPACIGTAVIYTSEGSFLCVASDPQYKGISQDEVAAHAKAKQKMILSDLKGEARRIAKQANTKGIADEIRKKRNEQAAKISEFPKQSTEYSTAGLEEAGYSLTERERQVSRPALDGIIELPVEVLESEAREAQKVVSFSDRKRSRTFADQFELYVEVLSRRAEGTADSVELEWIRDYEYMLDNPTSRNSKRGLMLDDPYLHKHWGRMKQAIGQ